MRRRTLLSASNGETGRGTIGDYEFVDLGLPSGLLWATCNVGATNETVYGSYYMYGKGSRQYNSSDTSYEGTENPLASSADTATQVLGSGWRMPTKTECQELIDNTNYSWATINGINGGKFTSKTNPNAYVFIPAAGFYYYSSFNNDGSKGFIWNSTPSDNASYASSRAYELYFDSGRTSVSYEMRYDGFSVRGVHRQPGKPMPPMSVLFVNKNDTTQKQIFKEEDWPSASDWTPIGIVVVPGSHNRYGDGTNGIMSLGCLNTDGTMQTTGTTDNVTIQWGRYGTDTSLSNYTTCDGSNSYGYAQVQTNSGSTTLSYYSTPNVAYPYTDLTAIENNVISTGSLSDYDGVGNTDILNASPSTYIAAAACRKFKTSGTSAGDWYLPAVGELAYLPSIRFQVNDTITALNTKYGNVGVQLSTRDYYWSSSECNYSHAWHVSMNFGYVGYSYGKDSYFRVRAFLRF